MAIYLYVKECPHCGLRYLGKTLRNPYTYNGSGKYWEIHIRKHQVVPTTKFVWKFNDSEHCTKFALKLSELNNIVESDQWANLQPENGMDGWVYGTKRPFKRRVKCSELRRAKIQATLRGRKRGKYITKKVRYRTPIQLQFSFGRGRPKKKCTDGFKKFGSLLEMAQFYNISSEAARQRIKSSNYPTYCYV